MSETPHHETPDHEPPKRESPYQKQDFVENAKQQYAQISAEFEKAIDSLKDPERRRQMTSTYLDVLQKGLTRAQDSLAKYQERYQDKEASDPRDDPLE